MARCRPRACRTTWRCSVSSTLSIDVGDLLEADGLALAVRDDDRLELVGVVQLAARFDVERLVRAEQLAGGQVDVPVLQRLIDFVDADLLRAQPVGIHLHADGVLRLAPHLHLRHAVHHRQARRDDRSPRSRRGPTAARCSTSSASCRMSWSAGFCLRNVGGVGMPAGRSGIASAIAVCTSTAALSIERARSNCSVTWLLPVRALRDHRVDAGDAS